MNLKTHFPFCFSSFSSSCGCQQDFRLEISRLHQINTDQLQINQLKEKEIHHGHHALAVAAANTAQLNSMIQKLQDNEARLVNKAQEATSNMIAAENNASVQIDVAKRMKLRAECSDEERRRAQVRSNIISDMPVYTVGKY